MSPKHDEQFDRLLTTFHRRADTGASAECLDAETLASWMDGGLAGPSLARVEAHAAGCARCQSMLAAMARTADAASDAQAGSAPARSKFWRMLPWAAPLTAAATAAALYVAVGPQSARSPDSDRLGSSAVARSEAQGQSGGTMEQAARPPESGPVSASRDEKADASTPAAQVGAAAPTLERPPADADAQRERTEKQRLAASDSVTLEARPAEPAPPPLPGARDLRGDLKDLSKPAAPSASAPQAVLPGVAEPEQVSTKPTQAPSPPPSARRVAKYEPDATAARGAATIATFAESVSLAPIDIATPDPAVRWRVVNGASVQLSRDGGTTWIARQTGAPVMLTAGAAPSASVCWLVGRAATVLRTTDAGATWQRVDFPQRTDFASIIATSADTATVTTTNGRTFMTTDGGKTWSSRIP